MEEGGGLSRQKKNCFCNYSVVYFGALFKNNQAARRKNLPLLLAKQIFRDNTLKVVVSWNIRSYGYWRQQSTEDKSKMALGL
jgi:hypothetical protein